jgi:hypothetical protein
MCNLANPPSRVQLIAMDDNQGRKSRSVRHTKLVINVVKMNFNRSLGEIELTGNFLIRETFAQ